MLMAKGEQRESRPGKSLPSFCNWQGGGQESEKSESPHPIPCIQAYLEEVVFSSRGKKKPTENNSLPWHFSNFNDSEPVVRNNIAHQT